MFGVLRPRNHLHILQTWKHVYSDNWSKSNIDWFLYLKQKIIPDVCWIFSLECKSYFCLTHWTAMQTLHSHNIRYLDLAVWSNLQIVRWQCYLTHSLHRRSRRQAHNHLALDNSRHPPHSRPRNCLGLRILERFILPTIKSWPWSHTF